MWRLALLFTTLLVCGFGLADEDDLPECSKFRLSPVMKGKRDPKLETYSIGIIDADGLSEEEGQFSLKIENYGDSEVNTAFATFISEEDGVFSFSLNAKAMAILNAPKLLPLHQFVVIEVTVKYGESPDTSNPPKFTVLTIGNMQCKVPEFRRFPCPQLPAVCPTGLAGITHLGFKLHLPVTKLYYFHLKIGFQRSQKTLRFVPQGGRRERRRLRLKKEPTKGNCTEVAHFIGAAKFRRREQGLDLFFRTGKRNHLPKIVSIEYGNRYCRTSCGINPCTKPKPTTAPQTAAPPVVTTEPQTAAPPVVTTAATEAPVVTDAPTGEPVVTTNSTDVLPPADEMAPLEKELKEILSDDDFADLDNDFWK